MNNQAKRKNSEANKMIINETHSLLLVALAAAILPGVSRLIRLPAAVTEILFGILLGKSCLGVGFSGDWLPFLAHLGFLMLMFQAGMEIDFTMLKESSGGSLLFQLFFFATTLALSLLFSLWLGLGVFMAMVLSTTSLGLVMPILKETGVSKTPLGQAILVSATLADFLTLLGITLYLLWFDHGVSVRLFYPLPLFIGFGLLLRLVRLWAWWRPEQAERMLGAGGDQELGVRFSLALLFLFVALSELTHLEPVLGAFMGGCVLSFVFRSKGELENKLSALGFGFLIPIFFIHVGMQFDLGNLLNPRALFFAFKLLIIAAAVKMIPSIMLIFRGLSPKNALSIGVLLSTRLSLIVAAAAIGVTRGLLAPEMKDSIVLLAILTCLSGPSLFKAFFEGEK